MENKAYALAAGLFTLLLGAAVLLAAMWLSGDTYEKVYYVLESKSPVTGLYEQAAVRFRGVDVGKVSQLRFDRENSRVILIEIAVQPGTPVTRSTYAEIRPQGLTGLSYVMLDDTGASSQPLPPSTQYNSPRIAVRPTLLENLLAASQDTLADVRQVAQRVSALLSDENRQRFSSTLAGMQSASERLAVLAKSAQPGVQNFGALMSDARGTLRNAEKVMNDLSGAAREVAKRMDAVDRMATSADKAGTSIGAVADSVAQESLPRINALVEELTRTTRGLDELVRDLKEQPQSVVFGRKPGAPGPGEPGFQPRATQTGAAARSARDSRASTDAR